MSDKTDIQELKKYFYNLSPFERGDFLVSEKCPNCGCDLIYLSRTDIGFCVTCMAGCGLRTLDANTPERALELWIKAKEAHGKDDRVLEPKVNIENPTNPSHYSRWQIEPLTFISVNNLDFLRGNIIKYIMRYDAKGGLEDLKKARVYLDKLIEKVEKSNE